VYDLVKRKQKGTKESIYKYRDSDKNKILLFVPGHSMEETI
jgi:hypothetical protein